MKTPAILKARQAETKKWAKWKKGDKNVEWPPVTYGTYPIRSYMKMWKGEPRVYEIPSRQEQQKEEQRVYWQIHNDFNIMLRQKE